MQSTTAPQLLRVHKARGIIRPNPAEVGSTQHQYDAASVAPEVTEIPFRLKSLEPAIPAQVANDDPVFMTSDAASILGITADRLYKWRQRDQGPDYLHYPGDYIRYELSALIEFKSTHRVRPSRQPHPGRRR